MYDNIHQPVSSLQKPPQINPGGYCRLIYFRKQDVSSWPPINPETGIINGTVQLKPGCSFYFIEATEKEKTFTEEDKTDDSGPYVEMKVTAHLAGNTTANTLSLAAMPFHHYGLIVKDRNGDQRLIGNEDSCARFVSQFTTGELSSSRMRRLQWIWQHSLSAPIYVADVFNIRIGGITISTGSITLILQFRVGFPGAPMVDGQEVLTDSRFAGKRLLVLASGIGVPVDYKDGAIDYTNSIERRIEKTVAGSTMTWIGGVVFNEVIEIYEIK